MLLAQSESVLLVLVLSGVLEPCSQSHRLCLVVFVQVDGIRCKSRIVARAILDCTVLGSVVVAVLLLRRRCRQGCRGLLI